MIRPTFALAAVLLAASAGAAIAVVGEPVRPTDDALVLATVPAGLAAGSAFRHAEAAVAAAPGDRDAALAFARLAVEEGRMRADPRFLGRAEAVLRPFAAVADPDAEVRLLRAVLAGGAHRFADALADLDAVLADRPDDAAARLVRANVRLVVGDVAGAGADCDAVRSARQPVPGAVCRARVAALSGQADAALAALRRIVAFTPPGPHRRFAALVAADCAAMAGRPEEGLALIAAAVDEATDVPLLALRADLLLDLGRPDEALRLLEGAGESDGVLLARARAARAAGDPRLGPAEAVLAERFAVAAATGNRVHQREEARFRLSIADDPQAALALATENWSVQKEPADARLLLEAALAAGAPAAARPVLDHLAATGLVDARLAGLVARIEGGRS